MRWERKGPIFSNKNRTYLPTVDVLDDRLRIYFAKYDEEMIGDIYYIEVDREDPFKILFESQTPSLTRGNAGVFDEHGVSPSCILTAPNGVKFLYYQGWMKTVKTPQLIFSGVAMSVDGGKHFTRFSNVPILDRNKNEYIARSAPFVLPEQKNNKTIFHLYYTSSISGFLTERYRDKLVERYSIRYGRSVMDSMTRFLTVVKPLFELRETEFGIARPCVFQEKDFYRMWFSYRGFSSPYQIGYAESKNGKEWVRKEEFGLSPVGDGFDSEMACFGYVIEINGKKMMFYNGNGYGTSGIGVCYEE